MIIVVHLINTYDDNFYKKFNIFSGRDDKPIFLLFKHVWYRFMADIRINLCTRRR